MKKGFLLSLFIFSVVLNTEAKLAADTSKPAIIILNDDSKKIDSNVLIVTNGVPIGTLKELKKDLNTLYPPEDIKAINVWKGDQAVNKFGDKAKSGVIEFVLKMDEMKIKDISKVENPGWKDEVDSKTFDKVEIEAKFPSGDLAWRKFLERTLNPEVPNENGAPSGKYTVIVQFIVDKEGNISNIRPLTNHGYGMEAEVMRVIAKGPKWEPAIQNGRQVKAYRKQPITFQVIAPFEISTKVIYAGKENIVEIEVDHSEYKQENIEATVSYGNIKYIGGNKYQITADNAGEMTITLWQKSKKKRYEIGKQTIVVH